MCVCVSVCAVCVQCVCVWLVCTVCVCSVCVSVSVCVLCVCLVCVCNPLTWSRVPVAALYSRLSKSLFSRGSTTCVSGSPNLNT